MIRLSLAVAVTVTVLAATPAQAEDPIVKLVSVQNGKCLQPRGGSSLQGTPVVQMTCNGSVAQQWTVHPVSSTKVHLINRSSRLCMDAMGKAVNGTPIVQWTCNTITNENWSFGITNNRLVSGISGTWSHCVATPGYPDGLAMELRFCDGDTSQLWYRPNG